jgi:protein-tyrosine-phosphatase
MRARLRTEPLVGETETQGDTRKPIPQPNGGKKAYEECVEMVRNMAPSPAQLQALDQEDTLSMLELIQKHCFKRGETLRPSTSAWIWALLAKLDDVGTMNNDEVFVLRDLGKRALVIQISFNNAAMAAQLEEISRAEAAWESDEANTSQHEGQPTTEATAADAAKTDTAGSSVTQKLDPENTLATLDMIVTIVGEFFGQRDLLDSRRSWDPEE